MNYFVIAADGQKYGPANIDTLNQWAQEGRVLNTSMLEDASTGVRIPATSVPGIMFPMNPPGGQNFQQPNFQYGSGQGFHDDGSDDIKKVWIFGGIGFFCCPIIFSVMAIVFASNAQKKGHPQAQTALIFAIASLVVGCGFSVLSRGLMSGLGNR
jgi:hypothetical protein